MGTQTRIDAAKATEAAISEKMVVVASSISFLTGVSQECHAGRLKLDGIGLSNLLSLIEREAFEAHDLFDALCSQRKEVAHG